ncbi:hypothetical protein VTJ49DRAFT_2172 [Mycothermus thermophilus]|uniref:F-box domain-containing protein n=1 Tax=Humicola insolens TaxID=85995 RepID=A0ABR3VAU7_HUMIN
MEPPQHVSQATSPATQSPAIMSAPRPHPQAILDLVAYNRADFELPVVSVHRSQHDAVRSSLFRPLGQAADFDLGTLSRLPFEILSLISLELDAASALRFSHVNRSAREVLAAVREFRELRDHALEAFCVLLRTGLGQHVTALDLHKALTTERCELCGVFGGFVFLPTAARVCMTCVASAPETRVTHLSRVADGAGVPSNELVRGGNLPVLHTLPDSRKRIVAVRPHALNALQARGMSEEETEAVVDRWSDSLTLRFQAATALPFLDRYGRQAQPGMSCKGCQIAFEKSFSDDHLEMRDRFYSKQEFLQHVEECEPAQKLLAAAQDGSGIVEEPRFGTCVTVTSPAGTDSPSADPTAQGRTLIGCFTELLSASRRLRTPMGALNRHPRS